VAGHDVRVSGAGEEPTVAPDPRSPHALIAASNAFFGVDAYTSVDGGGAWQAEDLPDLRAGGGGCAISDPAIAVGADGREYFAYLGAKTCLVVLAKEDLQHTHVYVSTRRGPDDKWSRGRRVDPTTGDGDKPTLAVDTFPQSRHRGRVYAAWTRLTRGFRWIAVAHSDDRGRTWSPPVHVGGRGSPSYASLAVARDGTVYVVWYETFTFALVASRARDGVHFSQPRTVGRFSSLPMHGCGVPGTRIPAQPHRCVTPTPSVAIDPQRSRLFLVYEDRDRDGTQGVAMLVLDEDLQVEKDRHRAVRPVSRLTAVDEFLPAVAYDAARRIVWVCFYSTRGDPTRRTAIFTCRASADDGSKWSRALPVAVRRSDMHRSLSIDYGDYEGLAVARGDAHPMWTQSRGGGLIGGEIHTRTLRAR
jgi:hypothetical protein